MSAPGEVFDGAGGRGWLSAEPDVKAEADELHGELRALLGPDAAAPRDGEALATWLDRMEHAGGIVRPPLGWHRDLTAVKGVKAAEARGAIILYPDEPDLMAAKAKEFRALPVTERLAAYRAQRAELLKEP